MTRRFPPPVVQPWVLSHRRFLEKTGDLE